MSRSSARGICCLAVVVAGYSALAIIAGAHRSPLTVPLPSGAHPPVWAAGLADAVGLDRIGRAGLIALAWAILVPLLAAFALVLADAWAGRLPIAAVLAAAGASLAISAAAPILLSRDVYTYAAYGRIEAVYHGNPYVATLASFGRDPFVTVASAQWSHGHSLYGPLFTLLSASIASTWAGSAAATILTFKLLAAAAAAAATGFAVLATKRTRPERAAFAAALVGLNPVLVVHTVGGAHVDALVAAPLAAAAAIALTRPRPTSAGALATTVLLTLACLVKTILLPALVLWLWHVARPRRRLVALHAGIATALTLATIAPFAAGWHTLRPLLTLGGLEAWASPSHLVAHAVQTFAGADGARVVEGAFLVLSILLASRYARRSDQSSPAEQWAVTLLLLALSMPYLLPWYAAWFVPLVPLIADEALLTAGTLVSVVLALTLIPADPFHGLTSPAVMTSVHYGAATALLAVLAFVAYRVAGHDRRPAVALDAA